MNIIGWAIVLCSLAIVPVWCSFHYGSEEFWNKLDSGKAVLKLVFISLFVAVLFWFVISSYFHLIGHL